MDILIIMLPLSLLMGFIALIMFIISINSGQYNDPESNKYLFKKENFDNNEKK